MKNVFKTLAVALTALALVSCGGTEVSSAGMAGKWKADPSSLDLTLGDGLAAFKGMIEEGKEEMLSEVSGESDKVTFDFKEDGKLVVSAEGEDETFNWSLAGDKLTLEGELEGQGGKIELTVESVSADKLTLALTAEDLLAQIKEQMPEAMNEVPGEFDVDAMAKGTSVSMSFKKS
jgi:hypothetical protein|tara:strand:- start:912 stop:1439 length:528 start_codon:yes stop_codon:yes gene_type:complete